MHVYCKTHKPVNQNGKKQVYVCPCALDQLANTCLHRSTSVGSYHGTPTETADVDANIKFIRDFLGLGVQRMRLMIFGIDPFNIKATSLLYTIYLFLSLNHTMKKVVILLLQQVVVLLYRLVLSFYPIWCLG